jgi:hypothetical protein
MKQLLIIITGLVLLVAGASAGELEDRLDRLQSDVDRANRALEDAEAQRRSQELDDQIREDRARWEHDRDEMDRRLRHYDKQD